MKRLLTSLSLIIIFAVSATAQDGHITYKQHGNTKHLGRTVLQRTDAANLDTLTSVWDGSIAYDTTDAALKFYDGNSWNEVAASSVKDTSISLSSAQILAAYGTPIVAVSGLTGKEIQVVNASASLTYVSTTYATNTNMCIRASSATASIQARYDISSTASAKGTFDLMSYKDNIITGDDLVISIDGGATTTGDGTMVVSITYRVTDL